MRDFWACVGFAAGCLALVLGWQKRSFLARQLGGYLLGYADSLDCKVRAVQSNESA